jgi:hypothetical protein
VRGKLGKTSAECLGRIIPISPILVKEMAGWGRREGWLIPTNRTGAQARVARQRGVIRAWKRSGVQPEVWAATEKRKGQSFHAFRKGFVSGLKKLRADPDAVEHLVGHSLGLRGVYTDPDVLELREAVDLIPQLNLQPKLVALDEARAVNE